jgi:transcriptional regulator with XRE-family HTH domain
MRFSQAELAAARMGTSHSTIARPESGLTLPSTKTLLRYAEATGSRFHVRLSAGLRRYMRPGDADHSFARPKARSTNADGP